MREVIPDLWVRIGFIIFWLVLLLVVGGGVWLYKKYKEYRAKLEKEGGV